MDEEEIKKKFEEIGKRLDLIEEKFKGPSQDNSEIDKEKDYSGLVGGIRFLIDNKILDEPKSVAEIFDELKKENYHYPKKSVEKLLSVDFMKKYKTINRIKENKKWKYVLRK